MIRSAGKLKSSQRHVLGGQQDQSNKAWECFTKCQFAGLWKIWIVNVPNKVGKHTKAATRECPCLALPFWLIYRLHEF